MRKSLESDPADQLLVHATTKSPSASAATVG